MNSTMNTQLSFSLKSILGIVLMYCVCGFVLGWLFSEAYYKEHPKTETVEKVQTESNLPHSGRLSDWQIMQMAIIKTESEFDSLAVGKREDVGILQITPIYVEDVNRIVGEEGKYSHEDAFIPSKSIEMFTIYQSRYNPSQDIDRAILLHNPRGYNKGYCTKVKKNMSLIEKYEELRAVVQDI